MPWIVFNIFLTLLFQPQTLPSLWDRRPVEVLERDPEGHFWVGFRSTFGRSCHF